MLLLLDLFRLSFGHGDASGADLLLNRHFHTLVYLLFGLLGGLSFRQTILLKQCLAAFRLLIFASLAFRQAHLQLLGS